MRFEATNFGTLEVLSCAGTAVAAVRFRAGSVRIRTSPAATTRLSRNPLNVGRRADELQITPTKR